MPSLQDAKPERKVKVCVALEEESSGRLTR
jgi:hypothetical protein